MRYIVLANNLLMVMLVTFPTAPHTEVTAKGDIVYTEVVRDVLQPALEHLARTHHELDVVYSWEPLS